MQFTQLARTAADSPICVQKTEWERSARAESNKTNRGRMPAGDAASGGSQACHQAVRSDKPQRTPACCMILGHCALSGFSETGECKLSMHRNVSSVAGTPGPQMSQVPSSHQPTSVCSKPAFMAKGPETTLHNLALRPEDVPHENEQMWRGSHFRRPDGRGGDWHFKLPKERSRNKDRSHLGANRSLHGSETF